MARSGRAGSTRILVPHRKIITFCSMNPIVKINISRGMMLFCFPYDCDRMLSVSIDATLTILERISGLALWEGRVTKKLTSTVISVLDSNMESDMKGGICGQISIQQNHAKYSPYWWWRTFPFTAHHHYRKITSMWQKTSKLKVLFLHFVETNCYDHFGAKGLKIIHKKKIFYGPKIKYM